MLNCISGMVEKTQSAISILQQRQAEGANVRNAEELVAKVQAKANRAILEVKEAALEEIKKAKREQVDERQNNCSLARYCGPFCQHKDWEDHARVCRADLTMQDISAKQKREAASPYKKQEREGN